MKKQELLADALAAAKNIRTESDLNEFRQMLTKITVDTAQDAELDDDLGFDKHEQSESNNYRNNAAHKTLQTEDGPFELARPRDRAGSFEPKLVKKHQRRCITRTDFQGHGRVIEEVVEWQSRPLDAVYPIIYLDRIVGLRYA